MNKTISRYFNLSKAKKRLGINGSAISGGIADYTYYN
jgi:hypothetical protein